MGLSWFGSKGIADTHKGVQLCVGEKLGGSGLITITVEKQSREGSEGLKNEPRREEGESCVVLRNGL